MSRSGAPPRGWLQLTLAVATGLACGAVFRVIPSWAFNEAFGIDRPPGVRDLRIWRHYEGGPGEHSLIFEFTADERTIRRLTAAFRRSRPAPTGARYAPSGGPVAPSGVASAPPEAPPTPSGAPNAEALEREWRVNGSWMAAYDLYGGAFHPNGRRTWSSIRPLRDPELFHGHLSPNDARQTLLLWERASGRTVVLHSRG